MPPEGKPQPAPDQISFFHWWIDAGAQADKKIGLLKPPARILRALQARYGEPAALANKVTPKPLAEVRPVIEKISDDLNISLTILSPNEPWLQCNASIAGTNFGEQIGLHQVHPLLVHAVLFGAGYGDRAVAAATRY